MTPGAASAAVRLYTTPICPYCVRAKRLLQQKGVSYEEIDVSGNDELRRWLVSASGQRTVPQIWIENLHVGGFDELYALDRAGKLDALLFPVDPA